MRSTTKTIIWFIWLLLSEFGFGLAIWWFFDTKWVLLIEVTADNYTARGNDLAEIVCKLAVRKRTVSWLDRRRNPLGSWMSTDSLAWNLMVYGSLGGQDE